MATNDQTASDLDKALTAFGHGEGDALLASSAMLIGANSLVALSRDQRMVQGLSRLRDAVRDADGSHLRFLARLWHMTAQAPLNRLRTGFVEELNPLPPPKHDFAELRDPNDRRYAAEALAEVGGPWTSQYAARALVQEESGERARAALSTVLFQRADNLNSALLLVSEAARELQFSSQDQGSSRARRLVRILDALSDAVIEIDPPIDDGIGETFAALIDGGLGHSQIGEPAVAEDLAASAFSFIRMLVRFHGTLAAEPDTFLVSRRLRRLTIGTEWPPKVQAVTSALARNVREALIFLARQGIADEKLRRIHVDLVGDHATGTFLRAAVGEGHGLSGHLAFWLVSGRMPKVMQSRDALDASVLEMVDTDLALAFRDSSETEQQLALVEDELIYAAQDVSEALGTNTEAIIRRVRRVFRSIASAAAKRQFRLRGNPGEVVEFLPSEHETADGKPASKTVRVRKRIVERVRSEHATDVVIRAEVERI